MIVVVLIIGVLVAIAAVSYNKIITGVKDKQAVELLAGVGDAESSWYRSHGDFLTLASKTATVGQESLGTDAQVSALLNRLSGAKAFGYGYVASSVRSPYYTTISIGSSLSKDGVTPLFTAASLSKSGTCFAVVVAPPNSANPGYQADKAPATAATCSADAVRAVVDL